MTVETIQMWFRYVGVGLFVLGFAVFVLGVLAVGGSVSGARGDVVAGSGGHRLPKKKRYVRRSDFPYYPYADKGAPMGPRVEPLFVQNKRIREYNDAIDRLAGR